MLNLIQSFISNRSSLKLIFILGFIVIWLAGCVQCGPCLKIEPKIKFAQLLSDTLKHPISQMDSLRVFKYYKSSQWDKTGLIDSTYIIQINWLSNRTINPDSNYYSFEIGYDIDRYSSIKYYDYWLKGTNNSIQLKLSKIEIGVSEQGGPCDCINSWFTTHTTINDSISDYSKLHYLW